MKYFILFGLFFFCLLEARSLDLQYYTITNLTKYRAVVKVSWKKYLSYANYSITPLEMPLEPDRCLTIYNAYPLVKGFDEEGWPEFVPLDNRIQLAIVDREQDVAENLCPILCDLANYHITGTAAEDAVSQIFNFNDFELLRTGRPDEQEPCQIFDPIQMLEEAAQAASSEQLPEQLTE